ncbi:hypothetical protein C5B42_01375 [Candidatus Cerribacteria bacterium 'Amazon FNV 2010 28 9']|uniref:Uncharacterized protein n=1 Tax=Candidatus Cerribacteria bacterium 'Amazon FNV 2010 28 9' TaxID=2081795 RepID=A0A317JPU9_9BACT|nr:MAG: hypothetical protein C5B42_01375 [Candidatus Cerribacteria bacterium 'Amazon FNV 2010 28 9']
MTCNLAVSIMKAALSDERLKALIDEHIDQVTAIMRGYLHQKHPLLELGEANAGQFSVGDGLTLKIAQGQVTLSGQRTSRTAQYMGHLSEETSTFLPLIADQLFLREVESRLKVAATITGKKTSDVTNNQTVQRATVYSIEIRGLKGRVFVLPGGHMQIFMDTGTFVQAKTATQELLQAVQAEGFSSLQMVGEVEQHRDTPDHVHVRHAHQRGGS